MFLFCTKGPSCTPHAIALCIRNPCQGLELVPEFCLNQVRLPPWQVPDEIEVGMEVSCLPKVLTSMLRDLRREESSKMHQPTFWGGEGVLYGFKGKMWL